MSKRYALVCLACLALTAACSEKEIVLGSAAYINAESDFACRNSHPGGIVNVNQPGRAIDYSLRTPKNYREDVRHPLLVVFPAAGQNNFRSEAFTRFTYPATAAGFVVLYPSHQPLHLKIIKEFGSLVGTVAMDWCIDQTKIYFTGHSDGGTVTQILAQSKDLTFKPAAIAPSAAGVRAEDLAANGCLTPVSTMLMHNSNDKLFPGFGRDAANWWAQCNKCTQSAVPNEAGCVVYSGCVGGNEVAYCETQGGHREWVQSREVILEFLLTHSRSGEAVHTPQDSERSGREL